MSGDRGRILVTIELGRERGGEEGGWVQRPDEVKGDRASSRYTRAEIASLS